MNSIQLFLTVLAVWPFAGFGLSLVIPTQNERMLRRLAFGTVLSHGLLLLAFAVVWARSGAFMVNVPEIVLYQHGDYTFLIDLFFDHITLVYMLVAACIGSLVLFYSGFYMHRESGYKRFFNTLLFFYSGYVFLLCAGNFETLFIGWEFIGIASFLLVAFYRLRYQPVRNAVKVYTVYRIGDVGLLLAMWLSHHFWHANITFWDLSQHQWTDVYFEQHAGLAWTVSCLVLLAALAKSAQFPFSSWLPRAMEGPTPSSAVFYGSLSVHLGVYLLLRTHTFWEMLPWFRWLVVILGLTTAGISSMISRVQSTIKGQIAYSSSAQIGLIFVEVAAGWETLALIHFASNALLRTYQLLISPSVVGYLIRDQFYRFTPRLRSVDSSAWWIRLRNRLYWWSLMEWNLDQVVFRGILWPVKGSNKLKPWLNTQVFIYCGLGWLALALLGGYGGILNITGTLWTSLLSVLCGLWAVLAVMWAYNERNNAITAWVLLGLANLLTLPLVGLSEALNPTEIGLFVGGLFPAWILGFWILGRVRRLSNTALDLHGFKGLVQPHPTLGFLFLVCALGMTGFPISTTFLGEDLLLSHVAEGDYVRAVVLSFTFVLNGIAVIRLYARIFLGHFSKSIQFSTPITI